jgi:Tfp pilus assembly protein FimT
MAEKSVMKRVNGYTVIELLVTVSIMTVLTGISLISIAAPGKLLEKSTLLNQISTSLNQAETDTLVTGKTVTVSITPFALWIGDTKQLEWPEASGWQWHGDIKDITLKPDGSLSLTDTSGDIQTSPKEVVLTYNQKRVALLHLDPLAGTLSFRQSSEPSHDICPN